MLLKGLFKNSQSAWILLGYYCVWGLLFKLFTLTILTYFLMSPTFKLYDISEAFSANELNILGICAAGFIGALFLFRPLHRNQLKQELFGSHALKEYFSKGLLKGMLLSFSFVAAMILSGYYHYLGYFIHSEESVYVVIVLFMKAFSLFFLILAEEYIFRQKLLLSLTKTLSPILSSVLVSLLYALLKYIQFSASPLELVTLFCASFMLSIRIYNTGHFLNGTGLYFGLLFTFHSLLGLPLLNNEFSGIFLVKYHMSDFFLSRDVTPETAKLITGGENGPLASLTLQVLFFIEALRHLVKRKFKS